MHISSNSRKDVTLVLVHAEWADGPSWDKVTDDLERRGHNVVVARIPLTSFVDDVDTLRRLVQRQDGPVVLAARSYVGAVMTAAAACSDKVKGLVCVSAMVPDGNESAPRVSLPLGNSTLRVAAHEIDWISAEDNYVRIYRGKENLLVRTSLNKLENVFRSEVLVRVHRSYMVNVNRVTEVRRSHNDQYLLVLADGTIVKCSRRYKRRLRLALHPIAVASRLQSTALQKQGASSNRLSVRRTRSARS